MAKRRQKRRRSATTPRRRRATPSGVLVVLVLIGAMVAFPFVAKLRHQPGGSPGDSIRGSEHAAAERSERALPPCPTGEAWSPSETSAKAQPPPHDDDSALDAELLSDEATHTARRDHGLERLAVDETLREIARRHSEHMSRRDFFSHDDPDGRSPSDRVHDGHRTLIGESGENIWMCRGCWHGDPGEAADTIVNSEKGWMHSPGHRANILRESFTHTAVGIAQHGSDLWATQLFASVRGHLFTEMPRQIETGRCVLVEMTPYPAGGQEPTAFDLVTPGGREPLVDPTPLGLSRWSLSPGEYRTRFHFPVTARRYEIVSGPNVEVR